MPGRPMYRMAEDVADLGVDLDELPTQVKPPSIYERTGLNADRRRLRDGLAAKRGKPSLYSDELAEAILSRMSEGQMLSEICLELEDAPHITTIYNWAENNSAFSRALSTTRKIQASTLAELAYVKARDAFHPFEVTASANYLKAVQWLASKLDPQGYGEKSIPGGASLNIADMAESDLEGLMATLQAEKNARAQARNTPATPPMSVSSDKNDE